MQERLRPSETLMCISFTDNRTRGLVHNCLHGKLVTRSKVEALASNYLAKKGIFRAEKCLKERCRNQRLIYFPSVLKCNYVYPVSGENIEHAVTKREICINITKYRVGNFTSGNVACVGYQLRHKCRVPPAFFWRVGNWLRSHLKY